MNQPSESDYKSADEIEREVDAARERVTQTIEAIEDKLSPGQLIDKLLPLYRQSGAAATVEHYGKSLGQAAQANPMPFLLIGAGIAWMALSSSARSSSARSSSARPSTGRPSPRNPDLYDEPYGTGGEDQDAQGRTMSERVHDATDSVREHFHDARDAASERIHRATDGARASMSSMRRTAGETSDRVLTGAREIADQHPLVLGLAGFTLGAAVGAAFPSTRAEDQLVGEYSDKLKTSVEQLAREQMDKAGNIASAAASAAKEAARDEGLSLSAGEQTARTLVDKIEHVGEAAIAAAVDEARTVEHQTPPTKQDV